MRTVLKKAAVILLALTAALLGTLVLAPAASAYGYLGSKACSGGGGTLNMSISYDLTNTQHVWGVMYGKATGDVGTQSNFRGRIYQNGSKVWEHQSADSYGDGEQWAKSVLTAAGTHLRTTRSATEKVEVHAWFDQNFNDPECTASITY